MGKYEFGLCFETLKINKKNPDFSDICFTLPTGQVANRAKLQSVINIFTFIFNHRMFFINGCCSMKSTSLQLGLLWLVSRRPEL